MRLHTGESGSTREDSRLIKVVAIQMMLFHHLAGYDLYAQWSAGRLSVKRRVVSLYKTYCKLGAARAVLEVCRTGMDGGAAEAVRAAAAAGE